MTMSFTGRSRSPVRVRPILLTTSMPSTTSPNTRVAIVEVRRRRERNEELPAIGVGAAIRHRHDAGLVVAQLRMKLVGEVISGSADSLAERIAALDHEAVDHAVEDGSVVIRLLHLLVRSRIAPLLRTLGQPDKILDCSRRLLFEEAYREISFTRHKLRVGSRQPLAPCLQRWRCRAMSHRGYHCHAVQFRT